jgi:hypothetical protein
MVMRAAGGMIVGLRKHLDVESALHIPWGITVSFLWGGTWSFILPPRVVTLPLLGTTAAIIYGGYRYARRSTFLLIDWFALLVLILFIAALTQHSLVLISIAGDNAPAWYLHSLAPILALLVTSGIDGVMTVRWLRGPVTLLLCFPLVFLPAVTILNLLFFAGCAPTLQGRRNFAWSSGMECLADYPRMYENLATLAFPYIGTGLFAVGWIAMASGVILALRHMNMLARAALDHDNVPPAHASTASIR